ncbi:MAG: hypothetical protein R2760_07200 [Chitinophagales bacterium]
MEQCTKKTLSGIEKDLDKTEQDIKEIIQNDEQLKQMYSLMLSVTEWDM